MCHNCGIKGSVFTIEKILPKNFTGLSAKMHKKFMNVKEDKRENLPTFISIFDAPLSARSYLFERISKSIAEEYKIQYCEDGLYRNRIILPVYVEGELVYFQARATNKSNKLKYLNPRKVDILLGKSELVFNIENVTNHCIIQEGYFDAISLSGGVATFGKSVSDKQIELLLLHDFPLYTILFDFDGLPESLKLAEKLLQRGAKNVKIGVLEAGMDANSNTKEAEKAVEDALLLDIPKIWKIRASL